MEDTSKFGYWGITSEEILQKRFPLHRACRDGDVEALSLLLVEAQHGVYVEDNFYGWTPAHWAAYFGKLNCLMRLMEGGMNCDVASMRLNQTPSHIAAFSGSSHCLKWLLHCGSRIDRQDYLGETPVHKAARTGSMECVSLLSSHGARLYITNNNHLTPAQLAATCCHSNCAAFLESAASRQEHTHKGIYDGEHSHSVPCDVIKPSPHDVTAAKQKFHPCVGNGVPVIDKCENGITSMNGHSNHVDECEMEEELAAHGAMGIALEPRNGTPPATDVTLLSSKVLVAGRKRSREECEDDDDEDDDDDFKRMRTQVFQSSPRKVPWQEEVLVFAASCIAKDGDDQDISDEDCCGYDYNGIPQYTNTNPTDPCINAKNLEMEGTDLQFPAKCIGLTGHYI